MPKVLPALLPKSETFRPEVLKNEGFMFLPCMLLELLMHASPSDVMDGLRGLSRSGMLFFSDHKQTAEEWGDKLDSAEVQLSYEYWSLPRREFFARFQSNPETLATERGVPRETLKALLATIEEAYEQVTRLFCESHEATCALFGQVSAVREKLLPSKPAYSLVGAMPRSGIVPAELLRNESFLQLPVGMLELLHDASPPTLMENLRRLAKSHMLVFAAHDLDALRIADTIELSLCTMREVIGERDYWLPRVAFEKAYYAAAEEAAKNGVSVGLTNIAMRVILGCYEQLEELFSDVSDKTDAALKQQQTKAAIPA